MKFGWHQDSGYVGYDHKPYLSCWAAIDEVSEENGTVYILPFSRAGTRKRQDHIVEEGSNDKIGYFGEDPGIPVVAPAGSIAVFSSVSFHRSSPNTSKGWRRIYLTQYSAIPILTKDGSQLWGNAEPFLVDGDRVTTE
jgi:ectoine hydroxylase-related dioxygenase (phytanoyl-CoA dioxygenase family)